MANTGLTFEFKLATKEEIIQKRGLESGGVVQQIVDSEVMRYMDPYIPLASGAMRDSMIIDTVIGSGEIQVEDRWESRRPGPPDCRSGLLRGRYDAVHLSGFTQLNTAHAGKWSPDHADT